MNPRFIIIKTQSKSFFELLVRKLTVYKKVHFVARKINGNYLVAVKCEKFFNDTLEIDFHDNIYQSYIYLYTTVSIVLSELIIDFFELKLTHRILCSNHKDLSPYNIFKLKNILQIVLDADFPSSESKRLYMYRKDMILTKLLLNFRNCNYIFLEHFVFFKLDNYMEHLENIVEKTCAKY